jgi:chaperone BCS1
MYSNSDPSTTSPLPDPISPANGTAKSSKSAHLHKHADGDFLELIRQKTSTEEVEPEKLKAMAEQFAEQIPEDTFSPAEIQGFLLNKKKEPSRAVNEVAEWRDILLAEKRAKAEKV